MQFYLCFWHFIPLFPNTSSLYSSLHMTNHISQPYKKMGEINYVILIPKTSKCLNLIPCHNQPFWHMIYVWQT
jgi:hypothetical protein